MTAKNIFLSVAVPTPIRCLFDYLPEKNAKHEIFQPGLRVSVSFGQRKNITGIIVLIKNKTNHPKHKLKRINHMDDKCFYDNYKYHPMEAQPGNGLYYNRDTLVNNYTAVGKPQCAKLKTQTHQSVITPGHLQTKQIELTKNARITQANLGISQASLSARYATWGAVSDIASVGASSAMKLYQLDTGDKQSS